MGGTGAPLLMDPQGLVVTGRAEVDGVKRHGGELVAPCFSHTAWGTGRTSSLPQAGQRGEGSRSQIRLQPEQVMRRISPWGSPVR